MSLAPGTRLGPYEILELAGVGGMGAVYRARDTRLRRTVAIKVASGDMTSDLHVRARLQHEARVIAALNHPHICAIYDVATFEDHDVIVMGLPDARWGTAVGRKASHTAACAARPPERLHRSRRSGQRLVSPTRDGPPASRTGHAIPRSGAAMSAWRGEVIARSPLIDDLRLAVHTRQSPTFTVSRTSTSRSLFREQAGRASRRAEK
jgi:hypothetical protein